MIKNLLMAVLGSAMLLGTSFSAEAQYNRRVAISNSTNLTVLQLFGSNTGTRSWQEDVLGSGVLGPYETVVVNWYDGSGYCMFDMKAVFENGVEETGTFNVCEESGVVFDGY